MADLPTHADLVQIAKAEILAGNALIDADVVDIEGHPASIVVNTGAAMASEVTRQTTIAEKNLYLDTAKGSDLDRLVWDRYAMTRNEAAPSLGTVSFSRATAAYGAITLAAGTRLRTATGIEFETLSAGSFGSSATGPVTVRVRSVLAGAGQRAAAGEIAQFVTTPADSSITVINSTITAGDADAETNPELRERARRYFENARRGTKAAIEYGALTVAGIRFAVATEVTEVDGTPASWVRLQVADRLGSSNATLTAAVQTALTEWRAYGIDVEVIGALVTYVTIALTLTTKTGYDQDAVIALVKAAIVAKLDAFDPGQTLYPSDIVAATKGVAGVVECTVTTPAAALAAGTTEALRTQLARITVTGG